MRAIVADRSGHGILGQNGVYGLVQGGVSGEIESPLMHRDGCLVPLRGAQVLGITNSAMS